MSTKSSPIKLSGKIIILIASIYGFLNIILSFILPQYFGWYRIEGTSGGIVVIGYYFSALGTISTVGSPPGFIFGILILEIIGGIVFIAGASLCIIGVLLSFYSKEKKVIISIGGILMLISPLLLIIDVQLISVWEFRNFISSLVGSPVSISMFWGSIMIGTDSYLTWGVWIGSFTAFGVGILALIGETL